MPRLTYLSVLFQRLRTFYADSLIVETADEAPTGYFTYDSVPLKPHLPVGLLYDIHVLSTSDVDPKHKVKATPFRLTVHFSLPSATVSNSTTSPVIPILPQTQVLLQDAFINSTKEADFLRSGTAKPIMSLSAVESQCLWTATLANDLPTYSKIFASLLPGAGTSSTQMAWRNIPLRIYLPATADSENPVNTTDEQDDKTEDDKNGKETPRSQIRVLQAQVPPMISGSVSGSMTTATQTAHLRGGQGASVPQTLGMALHTLLPSLFPSRRTPILAKPLLHGAVVPMNASLEELASKACYADGWVNVVVAVTG